MANQYGPSDIFETDDVSRVSMEYNMMSKLKSRLISSSSAIAFALLAFSFAFGAVQAHAEELGTISCPLPIEAMDATVAEELDVQCHRQAAAAQFDTAEAEVLATVEADPPSIVREPPQPTADASTPSASEGQAIPVEITQTVTVAALGQELVASNEPDITGTVPSSETTADEILKSEAVVLDRIE
jgi:hypothetical protein